MARGLIVSGATGPRHARRGGHVVANAFVVKHRVRLEFPAITLSMHSLSTKDNYFFKIPVWPQGFLMVVKPPNDKQGQVSALLTATFG